MERRAAADSRSRKTDRSARELRARWRVEAASVGVTPATLRESIETAAAQHEPTKPDVTIATIIEALELGASTFQQLVISRAISGLRIE